jgi:hypothetical protein
MNILIKNKPLLIFSVAVIIAATSASAGHATDMSIGGTAQYQWWYPAWNNGKMIITSPDQIRFEDNLAPSYPVFRQFRYGPSLSIRFLNDWEISIGFRYGQISGSAASFGFVPDPIWRKMDMTAGRYDVSADAGYYLFSFFKIFVGLEAEIFKASVKYDHISMAGSNNFYHSKIEDTTLNFTPELGVHFTVPLAAIICIEYNLSLAFQSGSEKIEFKKAFEPRGPVLSQIKIPHARYYAIGPHTSLLLKINIPKSGVSITTGAIYRLLSYIQKKSDRGMYVLNGSLEHDFRPVITASYGFSVEDRKKRSIWIPRPETDD